MPGKKTMDQAKKLGMKGSSYKAGKTVKMNMGMQVPNYQDTVRTRFAGGGKFGSIETKTLKPTGNAGVQNQQVGTPTRMPDKSAMNFATKAKAEAQKRVASLATDRPAPTSTPNLAGQAAAQASIDTNRSNFGNFGGIRGGVRGALGGKSKSKAVAKPVSKKKKLPLPIKRGGG
jgi:hypothetical protein